MGSRFIITTHWWADTSADRAWALLSESARWPRWWTSIARVQTQVQAQVQALRQHRSRRVQSPWRMALGLRLRLVVDTLDSQPPQWLTLQLQGDLQGQATLMLAPGTDRGLDITCRWELQAPPGALGLMALLFESRTRALLQTLALDLGRTLQCQVLARGSWQGRWQGTGWQGTGWH